MDSKTRTKTFLPQLKKLIRGSNTCCRRKLRKADPCLIHYLGDVSEAILKTDIKLPNEAYSEISPYRDLLVFLAKKKNSVKRKREKLLKQKGGAIPLLGFFGRLLASALGGFAGKAIADQVL